LQGGEYIRHFTDVEQTTAGDQLRTAMIGGAIHIDDVLIIRQGVVQVVKQFFQALKRIDLAKF